MSDRYILKDKKTIACDDLMEWGKWMQTGERKVADDEHKCIRVSTVFLGLDHSFGEGEPILFETMVFSDGDGGGDCERYKTWEEAEEGHKRICEKTFK